LSTFLPLLVPILSFAGLGSYLLFINTVGVLINSSSFELECFINCKL
jgi:hypothetical protein